ncbi:MAG: LapA family protein [bacterium]
MRPKMILLIVLVIVLLVMIIQNLGDVTAKFLFVEVTMPLALFLFIMAAVGFVVGAITALVYRKDGRKS